MKNIVNETPNKPTYAELESKVSKHDKEKETTFFIIIALIVSLTVCVVCWRTSSTDAKFYKDYKNEYFDKWRSCAVNSKEVERFDIIRLRARESELSKAEFEFRVKVVQWEAEVRVMEAKLQLQKERIILEREQVKFDNHVKATSKVIQASK